MSQYPFPSSPYAQQQPVVYTSSSHSQHGHGGYNYGTPLRRASSAGPGYATSAQYGYPNVVAAPQTAQYLSIPDSHHRSRSHSRHRSHSRPRHSSHSRHGGYSTTTTYPVTYATTAQAPIYIQPSTGHRSHSTSRRHSSHSRPSYSYASNGDYYRGRTPSLGDRFMNLFGGKSSNSYYNSYGNQGHGGHTSYGGMRDERRHSNRKHSGYVDEHGREVDHRGRPIHRY
ncbi:hypothetical protein DEU56DRAFT_899608 [Suillus clintonianus]|uniref:uncharacterized protein n=1 Tax=Suillus clintonianus TaxID=1904413 RepID=UPI001B87E372|nr:uncharacterized protein DEU56DRAFT_899608 [Suillus clintonianus]KAG2146755.1 hypothetical protein DEU56DRAFT_899608 [Suillus clintonianus]